MSWVPREGAPVARNQLPPDYRRLRAEMVSEQLIPRHISHRGVLQVMGELPRHEFVPLHSRDAAYEDHPLPIGYGQTISQPFMVAFMTQALDPRTEDVVLEVGTGSGYQTAVLSRLVKHVHTVEIVEPLARCAETLLHQLGIANVSVHVGDGEQGWPSAAPYDAMVVTCAPETVPPALVAQLRTGGRMVIPTGTEGDQMLYVMRKSGEELLTEAAMSVRFVPMTH